MNKVMRLPFFTLLFICCTNSVKVQAQTSADSDLQLKELLFRKYKREVQAYDKKKFDALFFEFFQKQKDQNSTLTKEEFYTYTTKIAAYSEKLGMLYKNQKEEAQRTKQEWLDKSYSDYLQSKKH
ncbi:hypothetical protein EZL74_02905 [Flavobacterium silvisoli]|uniref:EF-hand domain-containing protein n=1 Tax=Flavobacterium silvisoli TaxID=2529433 RepID=A0A4V2L5J2_9FLAO|nr:hypothetical protein [Flavobacterium silvisoli]TBX70639.1 hypothetical protein EZL74_02905 [Flavobacterium silvisoli]